MRTLARFDHYKCINNYKNIFDLKIYYKHKKKFLKHLDKDVPLQREIIALYGRSYINKL
jgi:hypothetical protein